MSQDIAQAIVKIDKAIELLDQNNPLVAKLILYGAKHLLETEQNLPKNLSFGAEYFVEPEEAKHGKST